MESMRPKRVVPCSRLDRVRCGGVKYSLAMDAEWLHSRPAGCWAGLWADAPAGSVSDQQGSVIAEGSVSLTAAPGSMAPAIARQPEQPAESVTAPDYRRRL